MKKLFVFMMFLMPSICQAEKTDSLYSVCKAVTGGGHGSLVIFKENETHWYGMTCAHVIMSSPPNGPMPKTTFKYCTVEFSFDKDFETQKIMSEVIHNKFTQMVSPQVPRELRTHIQYLQGVVDLAIVKIPRRLPEGYMKPKIIPIAKDTVVVDKKIVMTGHFGSNPCGLYLSKGLPSDAKNLIRFKPPVAPGFSGGAIFDMDEKEVLGIVMSISNSSGQVSGYAVPTKAINEFLKEDIQW